MTDREAYKALLAKKPVWQITTAECRMFNPSVIPDATARGFVMEAGNPFPRGGGGKDMFGVEWEFDPVIRGSTVRPGTPMLLDANDWESVLIWPNVDSWDWRGSAEKNRGFLSEEKFNIMPFMTGWYERLISLMDFEGAAIAMIDEDQTEAVKAFFDKLTDTYIDILGRALEAFPLLDGFWIHDDWGSAQSTLLSPETCAEMIVPYMKRVTDFLHAHGKHCDFHSCGMNETMVPNMIAAGWDSWMPQTINDIERIYNTYGDQLIISVTYPWPAPGTTEQEQLSALEDYMDKYCDPKKPSLLDDRNQPGFTELIRNELRKRSAEKFASK